jgi:hypothetical protein
MSLMIKPCTVCLIGLRSSVVGAGVAILAGCSFARAGETIIGPTTKLCREVTTELSEDTAKGSLSIMWVVGYVSGVNSLTPADFLKGRDIGAIIDRFRDVCVDSPNKTVLVAARDVAARLRFEATQRLQGPK